MLTSDELATLRAEMLDLMPDTCVIQRPATTVGSAGFAAKTYSAVGTAACRLDPLKKQLDKEVLAMQETTAYYRQLTVPYDTDLRAEDKVVIGGRTYEVRQLDDDHSLRAVRRAVVVKTEV